MIYIQVYLAGLGGGVLVSFEGDVTGFAGGLYEDFDGGGGFEGGPAGEEPGRGCGEK